MCALDEQVPLELSNSIEHVHGHRACRAGEVGPAECQTVNPDAHFREGFDGTAYIDSITTKAVQFGHDEDVSGLQLIQQPGKSATLRDGGASGNRLCDDPARLDLKAGGFDFLDLFFRGLAGCRDADIPKGARYRLNFVRIGCPKQPLCSKSCQDNVWTGCFASVRKRSFLDRVNDDLARSARTYRLG